MANVLFLSLVFPPDGVSTALIVGELAADLRALGHDVNVVTTAPHYNRDEAAERKQPLRPWWGNVLRQSEYSGIRVIHTWMPRKGAGIVGRLAAWAAFHLLSTAVALVLTPRPDVVIAPSPPLTVGVSAWLVCVLRRARFIYNVQEIYPDIAVSLGALRNRTVIRALQRLERFVYRRSAIVTVIAPRMRDRLLAKGVPADKLEVIPNFVDVASLKPAPKDNTFSREHHLTDRFVVTYAGNMGPAQDLDTFIEAAARLRDEPGIQCLLVGGGTSEPALRDRVRTLNLNNCSIVGYQPYERMQDIYAASDACLVPQAEATGCDAIPSKAYRILACGRPIVASTEADSDLANLVRRSSAGAVVPPGSPGALAEAIRTAAHNHSEWSARGEAGRRHVETHYSRERISAEYDALVRRLASPAVRESDLQHSRTGARKAP
jgi:colanic acid biosynthesis glycosyl transferase WcaI